MANKTVWRGALAILGAFSLSMAMNGPGASALTASVSGNPGKWVNLNHLVKSDEMFDFEQLEGRSGPWTASVSRHGWKELRVAVPTTCTRIGVSLETISGDKGINPQQQVRVRLSSPGFPPRTVSVEVAADSERTVRLSGVRGRTVKLIARSKASASYPELVAGIYARCRK